MGAAITLREVDVAVIRLEPGDMLACHFPANARNIGDAIDALREALNDAGHTDIPLLAFWDGVRYEIVRPAPSPAPATREDT